MPNGQNENFLKPEEKEFQTFYKREMWWLKHRALLRKFALGLFIAADAALVLFAGWQFLDAYVISRDQETQAVAALANLGQGELRSFSLSEAAKPLSISEVVAITSGDDKNYDLYAKIANNNSNWYATFKYAFKLKDGETAEANGFILPNEARPLVIFKALGSRPASVDLVLREVEWHRVDSRLIMTDDYTGWLAEHAVQIIDPVFTRGDEAVSPTVSFSAKNSSAYSYYQPGFLIVLWRGSAPVGLMHVTAAGLKSGETKALSSRWLGAVPAVSKVEVFPEINFFAPEAYSALEGVQPGDIRTEIPTR